MPIVFVLLFICFNIYQYFSVFVNCKLTRDNFGEVTA